MPRLNSNGVPLLHLNNMVLLHLSNTEMLHLSSTAALQLSRTELHLFNSMALPQLSNSASNTALPNSNMAHHSNTVPLHNNHNGVHHLLPSLSTTAPLPLNLTPRRLSRTPLNLLRRLMPDYDSSASPSHLLRPLYLSRTYPGIIRSSMPSGSVKPRRYV